MKFKKYLLAALLIFCEVGCERQNIIESPNLIKNKGYYLYVGNWGFNEVFIVDTDSNAVVDTLRGFGSVWDLTVTKSGKKLFICTRDDVPPDYAGKIFSLDLKTKEVKVIHNEISDVFVSPNGVVFVISYSYNAGSSQGSVGIIDTLTDAITLFDTLDIRDTRHNYQSMVFDKNRPQLYAVNNNKRLFAYNYDNKKVVRVYQNLFDPLRMVISPDGKFVYVAGGPVFDLERDSVIAWVGGNQLGSLALSPGGEYLYITDPGGYMRLEPVPTGKIIIFQTTTNNYVGEIDVNKAVPFGHGNQTDRIVLTPDGKTAYVSNWLHLIFVIDLQAKEVVKVINIPSSSTIPMALGLKQ